MAFEMRSPTFGGRRPMAQLSASDWSKQWSQVVAKAWTDAQFKKRLLADPVAALRARGP
jgi:hypothetical protein